jgi:hypothetical protein
MRIALLLSLLLAPFMRSDAQCTFDLFFAMEPMAPGNTYCPGDEVLLKATPDLASYQWYYSFSGTTTDGTAIFGATSSSFLVDINTWGFAYFYVVATDDSGCEETSDLQIIDSWVFSGVAIAHDPQSNYCQGDSALIENAFNGPEFFQWFKNFEPIPGANSPQLWVKESGIYTLSAAWPVCPDFWVSSGVGPAFNFLQPIVASILVNGNTLTASTGESFQWLLNGVPIAGATGSSYEAQETGSYQVEIVDVNGCQSVSEPVQVTIVHTEEISLTNLRMGPNPFQEVLHLHSEGPGFRTLELYDVNGRRVALRHLSPGTRQFAWEVNGRLPAGWYTCQIIFDDGSRQQIRLERM